MRTRISCFSILAIVIFFAACAPATAQETGSIRGIVVDQDGVPVSDAEVNASPVGGWRIVRFLRYVETDSDGHFSIGELALGKWGVSVKKEQAKYADTSSSFYSDNVFPIAVLTSAAPVAEVRVQLGPRAGLLTGSITNAANGAPIGAGFTLTRAASPDKWLSSSAPAEYRILLPSSTDVLVEVSEPGFTTWSPGHPLRLQPGAEVRMDIQLEPSHDPNLHKSRFLVPDGYTGWLLLDHGVKDAGPVPVEDNVKVFRFPSNGALSTSSGGPERGAEDEYFYYSANGSLRAIPSDYRSGGGMIWGQHEGIRDGQLGQFGFFVGSEEQYEKFKTRMTHPGPIPAP